METTAKPPWTRDKHGQWTWTVNTPWGEEWRKVALLGKAIQQELGSERPKEGRDEESNVPALLSSHPALCLHGLPPKQEPRAGTVAAQLPRANTGVT